MSERLIIEVSETGSLVVKKNLEEVGKAAKESGGAVDFLKTALKGYLTVETLRALQQMSDSWTRITNNIRQNVGTQSAANAVARQVVEIANSNRVALEQQAQIYNRVASTTRELGLSTRDQLKLTDNLTKAFLLTGAGGDAAVGGIEAFTKGLARGGASGRDMLFVLTQFPEIADVIARHLGVTRAELKRLAEQGQLSSQKLVDIFTDTDEFGKAFEKRAPTIGEGFTKIQNSLTAFVGAFTSASGAGSGFYDILSKIASLVPKTGSVLAMLVTHPLDTLLMSDEELKTWLETEKRIQDLREKARQQREAGAAAAAPDAQAQEIARMFGLITDRMEKEALATLEGAAAHDRYSKVIGIESQLIAKFGEDAGKLNDERRREVEELIKTTEWNKIYGGVLHDTTDAQERLKLETQAVTSAYKLHSITAGEYGRRLLEIREKQIDLRLSNSNLTDSQRELAKETAVLQERFKLGKVSAEEFSKGMLDLRLKALDARDNFRGLTDSERDLLVEAAKLDEQFRSGAVSATEFSRKLRDLQERALDLTDAFGSRLLKALDDVEGQVGSISKVAETTALQGVDVLAESFTKLGHGAEFFDSLREGLAGVFADVSKLIVKMLLLRAIARFIPQGSPAGGGLSLADVAGLSLMAAGGPVERNRPVIVGERGPEIFVPQAAGNIVPNGGGSVSVAAPSVTVPVTIVDDPARTARHMASPEGETVFMSLVRKNARSIRAELG